MASLVSENTCDRTINLGKEIATPAILGAAVGVITCIALNILGINAIPLTNYTAIPVVIENWAKAGALLGILVSFADILKAARAVIA